MMNQLKAKKQIETFLIEDLGERDLSSMIFETTKQVKGSFVAKETGIFVGTCILKWVFELLGGNVEVNLKKQDGEQVVKGDIIAEVTGNVQSLLSGERVILNLIGRMSGIATLTHVAINSLDDATIKICDTRKTMPGLRLFDKYAVTCGGGSNHRFGLYDAVMLKDNHIASAGGIEQAVCLAKSKVGHTIKIEVETETVQQVKEAVMAGADIIMFDNCPPEEIKKRIKLVPDTIVTEASGGITLENLSAFKGCGVHYISLGFITHSAGVLDISFNIEGGVKVWTS